MMSLTDLDWLKGQPGWGKQKVRTAVKRNKGAAPLFGEILLCVVDEKLGMRTLERVELKKYLDV
jgi:hypothetical protein